ncbi:UDP-glucose/GDP-mannose dehydrogenase family protein [Brevundimonas sp.]|uniref:UDP-glucose dehydrogenase family protein n=1 Tax=Brevundimonas sp. TaxID=1871086 RepID=UPI0035B1F4DF
MRVAMIGTGYVGLVSGACLADFGHSVVCVDKDQDKIARLKAGEIPIFEPGLEELVQANVKGGRLSFSTDPAEVVGDCDAVFIAVGTPTREEDGHADLSYVHAVAREIAPLLRDFTVVVNKSTVPVGTGDVVDGLIRETNPGADFAVVSNPEFLREGAAIDDFKRPDRVVIGVEDDRARQVMADLYRPLDVTATPIVMVGRRTSELIKYAANGFLAMKIAFINEVADLCEKVGADVQQVAYGIGLDKRIGPRFLMAGPGYGGSCFLKDTLALTRTAQEAGAPISLIEATVESNANRKKSMAGRVSAMTGDLKGKTVALLGLTFKPNTDDMRDAPSLDMAPALIAMGARVQAYDPEGMEEAARLMSGVEFRDGPYDAVQGADAVVILTEWDQFRALDLDRVKMLMNRPLMIDLRNVYRPEDVRVRGFTYASIGRG